MYNSNTKIVVCIFSIFLLTILFQNFSYAQLDIPTANVNVDNTVSYDLLGKIAVTKAQQLWGQVSLGQPIPCCDDNGDIIVYMFPFHIGSTTFPSYNEILKDIQEGRKEYQEIIKRLQEEKNNIFDPHPIDKEDDLPQRDESNINLNGSMTGPPELLKADMLISKTDELLSARTMAKYKKYGINEYGTIYVSARSDRFPIPLRAHYLCPYYSMGDLALQKAQDVLSTTNVKLEHYYFLGLGRGQYFEFVSGTERILIEAYLLHVESPEKILNRRNKIIKPLPEIMTEITNNWEQIISEYLLADHYVAYPDLVPDVDWCRGCTPTSASMAIGYWDNFVNGMTYGGFGRLINYWRELSYKSDGTGPLRNVPNILDELRIAMQTDVNGGTNINNISPGIEFVCNTTNGYNFNSDKHCNESDWNWSVITNEINNNRPFVWSVGNTDTTGHSLCAWGYTDSKFVITYSTWGRGRDDWYYNQYDNSINCFWSCVHTVEPGGSQAPHTMVIGVPDGGETLDINYVYQITWRHWGTLIHDVDLWYSTNGGESWITINSYVPSSEGWNTYNWTVPFAQTSRGRVRITAWDASSNYISGDGSFENFTITDTTPPSAPGTPSDGGDWTNSTQVTFTWTPAVDNGTGVVDYHLQIGTSQGMSNIFNNWIGNVTTYTKNNCTHCQTLYARVRAKNGIGLIGPWSGDSDGIGIDHTPPTAPGTPTDPGQWTNSTEVTFTWTPAEDDKSGIIDYHLQISTTPGGSDIFNGWIGSNTIYTQSGCSHCQTLYARVQAKNGAELIGNWSGNSDGIGIDLTPPSAPGTPTDAGEYTISTNVTFNWDPAVDDKSGITDYHLQVGTTPNGNDIFDDWVGNYVEYTVTGASGQTLYARVRAKNGAELTGEWSGNSDGIKILSIDVTFSFDLGCRMESDLAEMKLAATTIVDELEALGSDACFGVASFVDYCGLYCSDGYEAQYGDKGLGDYPWKINQQIISNTSEVKDSINTLCTCSGCDIPQDYARALLECLFLDWRPDSRKFVVMIGNTPAHDPDFFSQCYGVDPGPDNTIGTCDDLDYESTVNWVDRAGLTIISIDNGSGYGPTPDTPGDTWKNFEYMAIETGGQHIMKSDWNDVTGAIKDIAELGAKPVTEYPWTSEAEEMHNRLPWYGNPCEDGWRLTHDNQPICDGVVFLSDGLYHFTVTAKAEIAACAPPWLKVQIANEFSGTCEINSTEWNDYSFIVSLPAGFHCLSLTYLNDWWNEYIGDRNLLIDKVEITYQIGPPPPTSFTYEAEDMCQQNHTQLDGDYVVLKKYYSYVAHTMFFEQPELDFEIIAKADFGSGGWPEMEFKIDSDFMSVTVDNASPTSYLFHVTNIIAGEHLVKIDFKNDSWASGRKIYVDKLIIQTVDGGLLKPETNEPINHEECVTAIPKKFSLEPNYPNPFNPETIIRYQISDLSYVKIEVFNLRGQHIRTLIDAQKAPGIYQIMWNGNDDEGQAVSSGVYLYKMQAGDFLAMKKMVLVR